MNSEIQREMQVLISEGKTVLLDSITKTVDDLNREKLHLESEKEAERKRLMDLAVIPFDFTSLHLRHTSGIVFSSNQKWILESLLILFSFLKTCFQK
jgi:hypothetical protein